MSEAATADERTAPPAANGESRISGVVDGLVTVSVDDDGVVCLAVRTNSMASDVTRPDDIEVVLTGPDAELLGSALLHGAHAAIPCCVGVRLASCGRVRAI
jgi:hypothetical protein